MIDVVVRRRQNRHNVAACLEASKQVRAVYRRRVSADCGCARASSVALSREDSIRTASRAIDFSRCVKLTVHLPIVRTEAIDSLSCGRLVSTLTNYCRTFCVGVSLVGRSGFDADWV